MAGNPLKDLKPFRYAMFRGTKRVDTVTFYAKDQRHADSHARAWAKPDNTVRRIKSRG